MVIVRIVEEDEVSADEDDVDADAAALAKVDDVDHSGVNNVEDDEDAKSDITVE